MLKKFTVSNYRIFEEPITIDFSNVRDYTFNPECIKDDLVNKGMIYGKNAVGKTNLGKAIIDIRFTVLPNEIKYPTNIGFLNANSKYNFAKFDYVFIIDGQVINYIYEKKSANELKFECLKIDNQELYSYDFEEMRGNFENLKKYKDLLHLNLDEWDTDISILRYILTNSKLNNLYILKQLREFINGMATLRPTDQTTRFLGPKFSDEGIIKTLINNNLIDDLEKFLIRNGIDIKLKVDSTPDGDEKLYINYKRPIEFVTNASSGTKALTAIFLVLSNLSEIKFLFIDEFDANFHYELAESMLERLKEINDCQIIVTTHNTDLMNNKFMRPDCYYLMLPNKIITMPDATPRELRQGHNLEKLYQSGEFI
ncbi:ATP-binding protein [Gracilibacillus sp. S3-1-1]|uniref:ATP-binding protein n=1 Tax=Gracilibacillus pellucidus TaxID=3095368 RepID=A0ACC6M1D8_9BACI|nr:ATP-binding protein [Gracilibacillus sp. S3-1-1]MDX8044766.1 ATP-binding protein [Gracilibacillus sp. S3-1-1]